MTDRPDDQRTMLIMAMAIKLRDAEAADQASALKLNPQTQKAIEEAARAIAGWRACRSELFGAPDDEHKECGASCVKNNWTRLIALRPLMFGCERSDRIHACRPGEVVCACACISGNNMVCPISGCSTPFIDNALMSQTRPPGEDDAPHDDEDREGGSADVFDYEAGPTNDRSALEDLHAISEEAAAAAAAAAEAAGAAAEPEAPKGGAGVAAESASKQASAPAAFKKKFVREYKIKVIDALDIDEGAKVAAAKAAQPLKGRVVLDRSSVPSAVKEAFLSESVKLTPEQEDAIGTLPPQELARWLFSPLPVPITCSHPLYRRAEEMLIASDLINSNEAAVTASAALSTSGDIFAGSKRRVASEMCSTGSLASSASMVGLSIKRESSSTSSLSNGSSPGGTPGRALVASIIDADAFSLDKVTVSAAAAEPAKQLPEDAKDNAAAQQQQQQQQLAKQKKKRNGITTFKSIDSIEVPTLALAARSEPPESKRSKVGAAGCAKMAYLTSGEPIAETERALPHTVVQAVRQVVRMLLGQSLAAASTLSASAAPAGATTTLLPAVEALIRFEVIQYYKSCASVRKAPLSHEVDLIIHSCAAKESRMSGVGSGGAIAVARKHISAPGVAASSANAASSSESRYVSLILELWRYSEAIPFLEPCKPSVQMAAARDLAVWAMYTMQSMGYHVRAGERSELCCILPADPALASRLPARKDLSHMAITAPSGATHSLDQTCITSGRNRFTQRLSDEIANAPERVIAYAARIAPLMHDHEIRIKKNSHD